MTKVVFGSLELSALLSTTERLVEYSAQADDDRGRTAAIKAFEYSYELAWKTMKRVLEIHSIHNINSPREVMRHAFKLNMIDDLEQWLSFVGLRNQTVHAYNHAEIIDVMDGIVEYVKAHQNFVHQLFELDKHAKS